jgi:hypothetical protein
MTIKRCKVLFLILFHTTLFSAGYELSNLDINPMNTISPSTLVSGTLEKNSSTASQYSLLSIRSSSYENSDLLTVDLNTVEDMDDSDINPEIIGPALFYPNPFKLSEGSSLGYELSKNMDIEIKMYDMRGYEIYQNAFVQGASGGTKGYNKLSMTAAVFNGVELSAGIYFFTIFSDGDLLEKGKFAIRP